MKGENFMGKAFISHRVHDTLIIDAFDYSKRQGLSKSWHLVFLPMLVCTGIYLNPIKPCEMWALATQEQMCKGPAAQRQDTLVHGIGSEKNLSFFTPSPAVQLPTSLACATE